MPPKRSPPNAYHTPSQRSIRHRVSPASHSPAATPSLRHIPLDSPEWVDPGTTCLSLGLNLSGETHAGVICNNCLFFWEKKLRHDVANLANEERSVRMMCERPFDCSDSEKNSKYKYKFQHRDKLKSLFTLPGLVSSPAEHIMPSSRGRSGPSLDKNTTNRGPLKLFESNGSMTVAATNKIKDGLCGRTQL